MTRFIIPGFLFVTCFSSCLYERHGYYLSPQNSNSHPYQPIPMKADSLKSAIYANAVFATGTANDYGTDWINVFMMGLHRSHNFGDFQAYYGANLSLGSYHLADYYNSHYVYSGGLFGTYIPGDSLYHIPGSAKFFGGYGVSGGINFVTTSHHEKYGKHAEWRVLGVETSLQNEFGEYKDFRKNLPDSAANIIFRNHFTAYLGFYTEWLWTNRSLMEFGFKIVGGWLLNSPGNYSNWNNSNYIFPVTYFSPSFHVTKDHYTGFIQFNFGTYADNFQFGFTYHLGK